MTITLATGSVDTPIEAAAGDAWETTLPALNAVDPLRSQFERLAETWEAETAFASGPDEISAHPAYLRIIGLGPAIVPFIVERMRDDPNHWFVALRALTGDDPVQPEHLGDLLAMTRAWLLRLETR